MKNRSRAIVCAAALALASGPAFANTVDQERAEMTLGSRALLGIWDCAGTSLGKPVSAKIRWYHLEDHSFWMTLHPVPKTAPNQTYLEQWVWEDLTATAGYSDWRTTPDPASFDQASYTSTSPGFVKGKMTWIRHAAASTESRVFTLHGPGRISFYESYGQPPHVVYDLDCRRALAGEPPPA